LVGVLKRKNITIGITRDVHRPGRIDSYTGDVIVAFAAQISRVFESRAAGAELGNKTTPSSAISRLVRAHRREITGVGPAPYVRITACIYSDSVTRIMAAPSAGVAAAEIGRVKKRGAV